MAQAPALAARPGVGLRLLGCDFSSSPSARKPIVLAVGGWVDGVVWLDNVECFSSLALWQQRLAQGRWVGGFDLPFGLPRELVQAQGWPVVWLPCVQHYLALPRSELRDRFKAFCADRPVGGKWAHRATDRPAGSSPSMKWVNPPVAWMMHAGMPGLLAAGAAFPAHGHPGTGACVQVSAERGESGESGVTGVPGAALEFGAPGGVVAEGQGARQHEGLQTVPWRVALEAYPGLLARELLGGSTSYKSDDVARQTPGRAQARQHMVNQLVAGRTRLGLAVHLEPQHAQAAVDDARGDTLDALLALVQAAWCWRARANGHAHWGLPPGVDPLEGWIATA